MTSDDEATIAEWAHDGMSEPRQALRGEAASAYGRALLEQSGVDVEAVHERAWRGRPPVGHARLERGERSPRINVSITNDVQAQLDALEAATGRSRSELVREALDRYLAEASAR